MTRFEKKKLKLSKRAERHRVRYGLDYYLDLFLDNFFLHHFKGGGESTPLLLREGWDKIYQY